MSESRNMDGAMRIREVNTARERIGEDAFLESDTSILESFAYGLCEELVLNDAEYDAKLSAAIRKEAELTARREELERIARQEREEAYRIAREAREEAERIE